MSNISWGALFGGQGTHYKGMCKELVKQSKSAFDVFERANNALNVDLLKLSEESTMKQLSASSVAQPLVVTASCALFSAFNEKFSTLPDFACGHSLGEISALICSGALDFEEGLKFTQQRGLLMEKLASMDFRGSVGISLDASQELLEELISEVNKEEYVAITAYNSSNQFLVAGKPTALKKLERLLEANKAQFVPFSMIPMKADVPYHSLLAEPIKEELADLVYELKINDMKFPIYSTVLGEPLNKDNVKGALISQLVSPVLWIQSVRKGIEDKNASVLVEISPGKTTRNLVKETFNTMKCLSFDSEEDTEELLGLFNFD